MLGLPLFDLIVCLICRFDVLVRRWLGGEGAGALSAFVMALMLFCGYVLAALLYGGYLFRKHGGTMLQVGGFTLLTFGIAAVVVLIQMPSYLGTMYWMLPAMEQALGFYVGGMLGLFLHQRKKKK